MYSRDPQNIYRRFLLSFVSLLVIVVFFFIIIRSYRVSQAKKNANDLPIIRSEVEIVKVKKDNRNLEEIEVNSFYEDEKISKSELERHSLNDTIDNIVTTNAVDKIKNERATTRRTLETIDKNKDEKAKNIDKSSKNGTVNAKRVDNDIPNIFPVKKEPMDIPENDKSESTEKGRNISADMIAYDANRKDAPIELNDSEPNEGLVYDVATKRYVKKYNDDVKIDKNIKELVINEKREDAENIVSEKTNAKFYKAQLIALKNQQQANNFIEQTKKKYGSILKNLDIFMVKIDLREKGIFYRVQVGNFNTREDALRFCSEYIKLSNKNLTNCIVVK